MFWAQFAGCNSLKLDVNLKSVLCKGLAVCAGCVRNLAGPGWLQRAVSSCLSWGVTKKQQESGGGGNLPKHTLTFHFQKVHCPPLEDSVWFHDKYVLGGYFFFFKNYPVIASGYSMSVQQIWVSFTVPTFLCGACWGWLLSFNPFDRAICLRWSATFNVNPSQSNKTNGKRGEKNA